MLWAIITLIAALFIVLLALSGPWQALGVLIGAVPWAVWIVYRLRRHS